MPRFYYQPEHLDFLRKQYPLLTCDELTAAFNNEFGLNKTTSQIESTVSNHSIKSGRKKGSTRLRAFTIEQLQFCVEQYKKLTVAKLTVAFNKKFKTDKTHGQIRGLIKNQGIKSGRLGRFQKGHTPKNKGKKGFQAGGRSVETQFKKGQVSPRAMALGSERITVDGYIEVKIADPNIWLAKQRIVWEQHFGPIEPGHNIRFKDGNRLNLEPSNLVKVSNSEHIYMNQLGYGTAPDEVKDSLLLLAKCQSKVKQLESNR